MLSVILFGFIILIIICTYFKRNRSPKNLPPGPKGLPIIGTLPLPGTTFEDFAVSLQHRYGDIFSVQIGSQQVICVMRHDLIKKAFALPELSARPYLFTMQLLSRFTNTGIAFSTGEPWANARQFAMIHLRELGMGRSVMENFIQEEARALVQNFEKGIGGPMEMTNNINVAILNVIWKMVAGQRFDLTNKSMMALTIGIAENLKLVVGPMMLLDWFAWLRHLPLVIRNKYFEVTKAEKKITGLVDYLEKVIQQHQQTLDPDNIRDYIDHYLVEMDKHKHEQNPVYDQSITDLTFSILDLFGAATETTSSTLRWLFLYMTVHPQVQEKLQAELDQVVPRTRIVELQDELPYLDAVLAETHRHISITPFCVPHAASDSVMLAGYNIPKDAIIMGYLKGCHNDPKLWDNADDYRPERFLNSDGQFVSNENLLPFSTGRRVCPGESMARMELKIIGGTILQNFKISPPEGVTLNTDHDEPGYKEDVMNFAKPYKVLLEKRK